MKITGYSTLTTIHNWQRPIGDANGYVLDGVTQVPILIIHTDQGIDGIGMGAHDEIDRVFPAVYGEDPRGVIALYDRMLAQVFKSGHGSTFGTIGAIDMALWDIKAKAQDEPLWRLLGAKDRFVPAYASGLDIALSTDDLVAHYQLYADRGFTSGKLKGGLDVTSDIERLQAIGEVLGANTAQPALMLDANESWNRKQAVRYVSTIEESLSLAWIEEPVRRWDAAGLAAVTNGVKAAVASGENLVGLEQYGPLIRANAVDILQTGSVWGITHFLRVSALALANDLPVSPVGYDCNPLAHAAASIPNHLACEVQDLGYPIGVSVDQEISDGGIVLGDQPGLGITVDTAAVSAAEVLGFKDFAGPHVRPSRAGLRMTP